MYKATVRVTLRQSILDPQGKAAYQALQNLGLKNVKEVRIGKLVDMDIQAESPEHAREIAAEACGKLLANEVMEDYEISVEKKKEAGHD